ncbi:hypothetical protein K438DRAFT_1963652 [Mycena galopus ATCC 62051]|nr:hypothetical protein K438DRAFT_1963652 [Mycena galopus ATCC 62051]
MAAPVPLSHLWVGQLDEEHNKSQLYELLEGSPDGKCRLRTVFVPPSISHSPLYYGRPPLGDNLGALRDSIELTLAQSALTCFELTGLSVLLLTLLLSLCPTLRSLTLRGVTFNTAENFVAVIARGSQPARLEYLVLQAHAKVLDRHDSSLDSLPGIFARAFTRSSAMFATSSRSSTSSARRGASSAYAS